MERFDLSTIDYDLAFKIDFTFLVESFSQSMCSASARGCKLTGIDEKIGQLIKKARIHIGLSAQDVAIELGLSAAEFLRIEQGIVRPDPEHLVAMAELFRVQPSWFFPTAEEMQTSKVEPQVVNGRVELIVDQVRILVGQDFDAVTLRRVLGVLKERVP